jgi:thiamine biosynthesis lipoprotein
VTAPAPASEVADSTRSTRSGYRPNYRSTHWRTWGTYVFLAVADGELLDGARELAETMLAEFDLAASRFRADSDLSRANAAAGDWVAVSPLLVQAVRVALEVAEDTGGLVDPTLGLSLAALGYDDDLDRVQDRGHRLSGADPADLPPPAPPRSGAWREVAVQEPDRLRVPSGVALDLGATGKALAADRISAAIAYRAGTDCILSLGGDVAIGTRRGGAGYPHRWQVSVSELPDSRVEQILALPHGAIATSSTLHRTWRVGGQPMHHLLDPATGRPVQQIWRTATVQAEDCVAANAASTAALVLGAAAPGWLTERGLAARLVGGDGSVCTLGQWPEPAAEGPG